MNCNRNVLVLDDNEGNRMLLEVALRTRGFSSDGAATGVEALEKARRKAYVVALLDVNLPDMNGLDVASEIRTFDDEIVLAAVTIDDDDATMRHAKICGCDVFMIKPFDLDQLLCFFDDLCPEKLRSLESLLVIDNEGGDRYYR